jgi:hypothetical protein
MKIPGLLLVTAALIPLCGCINLSFGSRRPPPAEPVVVIPSGPLTPGDAATMAEIDAAAKLRFDGAKQESLNELARRPGLSPAAQVHLVNTVYRKLSFDNAKVDLLRTLILNPAFSDAARQAIVTQLDHLAFDSHKQEILRQLNQRISPG